MYRYAHYRTGSHHNAEVQLYDAFLERYRDGLVCSSLWFKAAMLQQVKELYPEDESKFQASESWRQIFFKRFRISFRKCTRLQPLPIAERIDVIEFYKKIRWICKPTAFVIPDTPVFRDSHKWGRFPLNKRHHADEVPLEFQGVLSRTAAPQGVGGVHTRLPKVTIAWQV